MSETKTNKKSKKRANGDGTFYQLEDRTWVHQITIGRKPNGSPDRKAFTGKTRAVCIEKREAYKAEKEQSEACEQENKALHEARMAEAAKKGHSLESETLFNEAFMHWLKLFKSPPTKKATTYSGYLDIYHIHFADYFGTKMLWEITQDIVQEYYKVKQLDGSRKDGRTGGLSAKTIRNHHMLLKDFFTYAVKKYSLETNPTLETERPVVYVPQMRVMDSDEMSIFLKEVIRETHRAAIIFDLFTGLRVGELLALELSDIDVKTQSVQVKRNITRVKTGAVDVNNPNIKILNYNPEKSTHLIIQESPKTESSRRIIPIPDDLYELLIKHLYYLEQSGCPNPNNLLFPSTKGTHIDPKSYELRLKAVSKRCEIKKVNPHALRHTFATRLVEQNVQLTTLQKLMGHASLSTTQRYVTTMIEEKRKAVESMSAHLHPESMTNVKKLNGAKNKMKYEDVRLPSWLQTEPGTT